MMEILVFKTNLHTKQSAWKVMKQVSGLQEVADCYVDLADCDRILRVETTGISASRIICILQQMGFCCEELE